MIRYRVWFRCKPEIWETYENKHTEPNEWTYNKPMYEIRFDYATRREALKYIREQKRRYESLEFKIEEVECSMTRDSWGYHD